MLQSVDLPSGHEEENSYEDEANLADPRFCAVGQ